MKTFAQTCTLVVAAISMSAAMAVDLSGSGYSGSQARTNGQVFPATVIHVRYVNMDKSDVTSNVVAPALGGLLGGLLGNNIGDGNGRIAATVVGGVVGAGLGTAYGQSGNKVQGQEIVIRRDNSNEMTTVTQEVDEYPVVAGQSVFLLVSNGVRRVIPAQ